MSCFVTHPSPPVLCPTPRIWDLGVVGFSVEGRLSGLERNERKRVDILPRQPRVFCHGLLLPESPFLQRD